MRRAATSNGRRRSQRSGSISIHLLTLMVPVFFGLMGFAVDLGRLYSAKGELKTASESMALAGAGQLIGTDAATDNATASARRSVETSSGFGNRYDFGSLAVGETTGSLNSEIVEPTYYDNVAAATGIGDTTTGTAGEVGGSLAKHMRVELTGEVPLTFWRFLSLGQEGKVALRVRSTAGVSAPVCTACGTEPVAIAPVDATDTTNFGFVTNTKYTFGYSCTGAPVPQPLADSSGGRVAYLILNRLNDSAQVFSDDSQQLFRDGAQGLVPSTTQALSCFTINNADEVIWATANTLACNTNRVQTAVTSYLCGLATRMDNSLVQGCTTIADVDTLNGFYTADTDLTDLDDYTGYTGNGRRILTVTIVDALNPTGTMTVLGFRQFLLEPLQNQAGIAPNDANGRFRALYIGNVAPLRQGRVDGGCGVTSGPGKVVLHQ